MRPPFFFTLAVVVVVVASGVASAATCNRDNCFRNLSNFAVEYQAMEDCNSFLESTITSLSAVTSVTTASLTVTTTHLPSGSSHTVISSTTVTSTSTSFSTETFTTSITSTSFSYVTTEISTIDVGAVYCGPTVSGSDQLAARASPTTRTIPRYASACSNTARYISACFCIDAQVFTRTLTQTTTTTETTTATQTKTRNGTGKTTLTQTFTSTVIVPTSGITSWTKTVSLTETRTSTITIRESATTPPFSLFVNDFYGPTHLGLDLRDDPSGGLYAVARNDSLFALDRFGFIYVCDTEPIRYLVVQGGAPGVAEKILAVASPSPPDSKKISCTFIPFIDPTPDTPPDDRDVRCEGGNNETMFSFCGATQYLSLSNGAPNNTSCELTRLIEVP